MSSWAVQPKRTLLNDANRSRFSNHQPSFENNSTSPGPAGYSPRKLLPQVKGAVSYQHVPPGHAERDRVLSNGVKVDSILPINSLSYAKENFPKTLSPPQSPQSSARRAHQSPRFAKPVTDAQRYGKDMPGPGAYVAPSPPVRGSKWSQKRRSVCDPIPKNEVLFEDPPTAKKRFSPRLDDRSVSPANSESLNNSTQHNGVSPRKGDGVKGGKFNQSPRHLNMHNLNSNFARQSDSDFENPAPGRYNATISPKSSQAVAGNKGKFSTSPRKMDVAKNVYVPGPGSYNANNTNSGSAEFYAPL